MEFKDLEKEVLKRYSTETSVDTSDDEEYSDWEYRVFKNEIDKKVEEVLDKYKTDFDKCISKIYSAKLYKHTSNTVMFYYTVYGFYKFVLFCASGSNSCKVELESKRYPYSDNFKHEKEFEDKPSIINYMEIFFNHYLDMEYNRVGVDNKHRKYFSDKTQEDRYKVGNKSPKLTKTEYSVFLYIWMGFSIFLGFLVYLWY